jgi:hypothetical protein
MALKTRNIIPLIFSLGLVTCQPEPASLENRLPYHFVEFIRHSEGCLGDSTSCAVFKALYPKYDSADAEIRNRINQSIMETMIETISDDQAIQHLSLQEVAQNFFQDYQEYAADPFTLPWELECNGEVIYLSDQVFSLAISNYRYTGGAHPNTVTHMLNYDLHKGQPILLRDLVIDWDGFSKLAERYFRQSKGIDLRQSWEESGYFWGEEFKVSNNFAITEQGIKLYYNTYEIAPYAAGITEFIIPYQDLRGIILPAYLPKAT